MGKSAKADSQVPRATAAATSSACLTWNAEASCSSAAETESAIEDVLGRRLFTSVSCNLQVNALVHRNGRASWQADLTFMRSDGRLLGVRTLESPSPGCKALENPIALVVALMVEDNEAQSTLRVPPEERGEKASVAQQHVFTTLVGSRGLLPSADLGTTVGVDFLARSWLPSRVDTTWWLPESSASNGPGGQFWSWHAGAAACPSVGSRQQLGAGLCIGAQVGMLHGKGLGLAPAWSATRAYGDVQARAMAWFPAWGNLLVTAHVGAAVPWLRPRFAYLDANGSPIEIHRPSPLVLLAGLGVELPIVSVSHAETATP